MDSDFIPRPHGDLTPKLRAIRQCTSPQIVRVFDRIRKRVEDLDGFEEFWWFAREYPRCFRFHADAAQFRLKSIHAAMESIGAKLVRDSQARGGQSFEEGVSGHDVEQIYWDFESFLSEVSISLDMLARIVSPAFIQHSPPSFSKLCKWSHSHPLLDILRAAKGRWVDRVKDYRDCFIHYTPVDTLLIVVIRYYRDGWELRAKLPTNPNVREILGFRFSRRTELLRYAIATYANLMELDRRVARAIWTLHRADQFPQRREDLFFLGSRGKRETTANE